MAYKDPERKKKWNQEYREWRCEYTKRWRKEHREQHLQNKKRYRNKHKEEIRKKDRIYWAKTGRTTLRLKNGKRVRALNKRERSGYCELCDRENTFLNYHHWDDKNFSKGIWVCNSCHKICEYADKGKLYLVQRYMKLKRFLDKKEKKEAKNKSPTLLWRENWQKK